MVLLSDKNVSLLANLCALEGAVALCSVRWFVISVPETDSKSTYSNSKGTLVLGFIVDISERVFSSYNILLLENLILVPSYYSIFLFIIIRIVDTFHKGLSIIYLSVKASLSNLLMGELSITQKFQLVSATNQLKLLYLIIARIHI